MKSHEALELEQDLGRRRRWMEEREDIAKYTDSECEVSVGDDDQSFIAEWDPIQASMLEKMDEAIESIDERLAKHGITIED